jgi:hypothetical protein
MERVLASGNARGPTPLTVASSKAQNVFRFSFDDFVETVLSLALF